MPLPGRAARAVTVDHDVVPAHRVAQSPREALQLLLKPIVLEGGDPAARVADRVVMMLSAGNNGLVPGSALADLDPLDQPHLVQQVERAVDAGEADLRAGVLQAIRDLLSGEAAALVREQGDDCLPRAAGAVPALAQRRPRGICPISRGRVSHATRLTTN